MNLYSDEQIVQGILEGDPEILNFVYERYFGKVENYFLARGADTEHIKDVFQEALIVIYQKMKHSGLVLSCTFSTYLFAVCINIWKHDLRKKKYHLVAEDSMDIIQEETVSDQERRTKMEQLFRKHFKQLSPDCQKLLKLHFNRVPLSEIMERMAYSSEHYTSDRKYRCKQSLYNRIRKDPKFREISSDE